MFGNTRKGPFLLFLIALSEGKGTVGGKGGSFTSCSAEELQAGS